MDIFSNLQVIGECLLDRKRVLAFERAVSQVVQPGDVVLDVGTGSGIIALLAAKAGAKKVYAVEIAEDIAKFAKKNIKESQYNSIIEVITTDIKDFILPHSVDVVTAELLDTCLVSEQQTVALNYLRGIGVIDEHTNIIPFRVDCALEVVSYDFNFYSFSMPFAIQARNYGANQRINKALSDLVIYRKVDFRKLVNPEVSEKITIHIQSPGLLNAVMLRSKVYLGEKISLWGTSDMNMPVIIPVNPLRVKKGGVATVHLKYKMGEGFGNLSIQVTK